MALAFALSPFLVVGFGALLLMLAEAASRRNEGLALGATAVFVAAAIFALGLWFAGVEGMPETKLVAPWLVIDRFAVFFQIVICLGGALAALTAGGYLREHGIERGEFYAILLFASFGAMMLASSRELIVLFLGLETMSIGAYALAAYRRGSARAVEGALKYFLLGAFAAAILLYGFALLYGATGETDLVLIAKSIRAGASPTLVLSAMVLIVVGLAFKVSAVPFHAWTPDAYEGAPTPATSYMAVIVKAGGFAMMLRVLLVGFGDPGSASWASGWPPIVAGLAVATMTVANLVAGRQESVKRMLAYSSIAHAGYILVGVTVAMNQNAQAVASVLFYLLAYAVSTAGAFAALALCGSRGREAVSYEDIAGLGKRHPAVALALSFFVVSLAGIPPVAGFFGKWFVMKSAIDGGFYALAIISFLNSVVGAYYYLKVLVFMYMREPSPGAPIAVPMRSGYITAAILIAAFFVLAIGLAPSNSLSMALRATVL